MMGCFMGESRCVDEWDVEVRASVLAKVFSRIWGIIIRLSGLRSYLFVCVAWVARVL